MTVEAYIGFSLDGLLEKTLSWQNTDYLHNRDKQHNNPVYLPRIFTILKWPQLMLLAYAYKHRNVMEKKVLLCNNLFLVSDTM